MDLCFPSAGFQFNQQMNGGVFFTEGFAGFGGGAQMSGSHPQTGVTQQHSGSPAQQQLLQLGERRCPDGDSLQGRKV